MKFYSKTDLDDMRERISELMETDFNNMSDRRRINGAVELLYLKTIFETHNQIKQNLYESK